MLLNQRVDRRLTWIAYFEWNRQTRCQGNPIMVEAVKEGLDSFLKNQLSVADFLSRE